MSPTDIVKGTCSLYLSTMKTILCSSKDSKRKHIWRITSRIWHHICPVTEFTGLKKTMTLTWCSGLIGTWTFHSFKTPKKNTLTIKYNKTLIRDLCNRPVYWLMALISQCFIERTIVLCLGRITHFNVNNTIINWVKAKVQAFIIYDKKLQHSHMLVK